MNEIEPLLIDRIQALEKVVLLLVSYLKKPPHANLPILRHHDAEHLAQILLDARPKPSLDQQKSSALATEMARPFTP